MMPINPPETDKNECWERDIIDELIENMGAFLPKDTDTAQKIAKSDNRENREYNFYYFHTRSLTKRCSWNQLIRVNLYITFAFLYNVWFRQLSITRFEWGKIGAGRLFMSYHFQFREFFGSASLMSPPTYSARTPIDT